MDGGRSTTARQPRRPRPHHRGWRRLAALALVPATGAGLPACGFDTDVAGGDQAGAEATVTTAPPPPAEGPASAPPGEATALVDQLTVAPEASDDGYDRELFDHWVDADGDGCHTRCEVLAAERRTDLPGLPEGGWLSLYDGYSTPDASELDIDHVVALAEAWRSGADGWDAERREAFANDLDDPAALVAVTAATNRSKGDRDPASWQPPNRDAWCEYATAWVATKLRWGLSADQAEVDALRNMLRGC